MDVGKLGRAALTAYLLDRLTGDRLTGAFSGLWAASLSRGRTEALRGVGAPATEMKPNDPRLPGIDREIATRIKGVSESTKDRIREYVRRNAEAGGGLNELAKMIREDPSGAFGRARARTIARTESGTAYNRGSAMGWRDSGRVSRVRVFDGDDCGWATHTDSDKANGSVRDLDEIDGHELAHPNCLRSFAPLVDL